MILVAISMFAQCWEKYMSVHRLKDWLKLKTLRFLVSLDTPFLS